MLKETLWAGPATLQLLVPITAYFLHCALCCPIPFSSLKSRAVILHNKACQLLKTDPDAKGCVWRLGLTCLPFTWRQIYSMFHLLMSVSDQHQSPLCAHMAEQVQFKDSSRCQLRVFWINQMVHCSGVRHTRDRRAEICIRVYCQTTLRHKRYSHMKYFSALKLLQTRQ